MLTRTPAAHAAAAAPATRPLYLVEIGWSPISRLSTHGTQTWNSLTWNGTAKIDVTSISQAGDGNPTAQISLGNATGAFGALAMSIDISDVPVRIWQADAAALALDDVRLAFEGVIDGRSITMESVTLSLVAQRTARQVLPATVIGPAAGFNVLLPAGTRITSGGITTTLMRG